MNNKSSMPVREPYQNGKSKLLKIMPLLFCTLFYCIYKKKL